MDAGAGGVTLRDTLLEAVDARANASRDAHARRSTSACRSIPAFRARIGFKGVTRAVRDNCRSRTDGERYLGAVYLTRIGIDHVKLLVGFELDLTQGSSTEPRMWTVLVGENGRCKTTILRAIALAASGAARANELADLAALGDGRSNDEAQIHADFALPASPKREHPGWRPPVGAPDGSAPGLLKSTLVMPPGVTSMRGVSNYDEELGAGDALFEIRGRNLPGWFVCGYGTTRFLPRAATVEPVTNASVARLSSLFDRGALIGTGFADLLEQPNVFSSLLKQVLIGHKVLPEEAIDIELRGRGGIRSSKDLVEGSRFKFRSGSGNVRIPAAWLSQGYQSTIAWIADLLGHLVLEAGPGVDIDLANVTGLVLIDEIDLHLHPRWQARLVTALRAALPKVQFIVTTHSPMVLPALRREEIVLLALDERGNVVPNTPDASPMLQTGSELYRDFFGINEAYPLSLAEDHRRYAFLVGNPVRSDAEEEEMLELRKKFQSLGLDPGWEPVARRAP